MKLFLVFIHIFIFGLMAGALEQSPVQDQKQGYKLNPSKPNSQVDIFLFSQALNEFNLFPLDTTHRGSILKNDFDQIFIDRSNYNNFAVLKFDLHYLGSPGILKLSATDYVCHGTFDHQRSFTLFSSGIDSLIMEKICQKMSPAKNAFQKNNSAKENFSRLSFLKLNIIQNLLINTSQAQINVQSQCKNNKNIKDINSIKNISSYFSSELAIQKIGSCLADVLRGSGHVFEGLLDGAKNLLTMTPAKLWNSLKETASGIKHFVLNIKDELIKLKNSFSQLNADLILSIGCQLAGEIITSAGISALTGAGYAMMAPRIAQIINKMGGLKHLFGRLNKMSQFGNSKLAEKVLSCGIK